MDASATGALRDVPFFCNLSGDELDEVLRVGHSQMFEAGRSIVEEGDAGDAMFVILSGAAEVDVGGRFHRLGPGDFFGEMALISSKRRTATVRATEPVEALRIPAVGFQALLMEHPALAVAMLRGLVDRLGEVQARIDAWIGNG
jgi:CRP-like cAMP-binding protein